MFRLMKSSVVLLVPLTMLAFIVGGAAGRGDVPDAAQRVADAHGLERWNDVRTLRYTFNAQVGDRSVSRTWTWSPHTDEITYEGPDAAGEPTRVTYRRGELSDATPENIRRVDQAFINDRYWLLFPLHLVWDDAAAVTDDGPEHDLPVGEGAARRITVAYPPEGGYTPGDRYELFVNDEGLAVAWVYYRGGGPVPTRVSSWEDHQRVGPLVIAADHRGTDAFRVWFTDLAARTVDAPDEWMEARPLDR